MELVMEVGYGMELDLQCHGFISIQSWK